MAVRLQMKLGVVAEHDRLPDSPDTARRRRAERRAPSRARRATSTCSSRRASPAPRACEATRLVAETIRNEYYYDESAGIRVCLDKAIATANKRLEPPADGSASVGRRATGRSASAVAVVRGNELYVATVGPAEAYLIRQARLSTLPDPHRERGLPSGEPGAGRLARRDHRRRLARARSRRTSSRALGADELKDAMVTLHPQSAMEHLHAPLPRRRTGRAATAPWPSRRPRSRRRPAPGRSCRSGPPSPWPAPRTARPIPLADNVQAAARGAVRPRAGTARVARRRRASSGSSPAPRTSCRSRSRPTAA